MSMNKFESIRKLFPGVYNNTYLDTSTSGLISRNTYEAMNKHLRLRMDSGLTIEAYWDKWNLLDDMRKNLAEFLNCLPEEVYFGSSSSDMINAFSANIEVEAGKEILIPDISFPATRNTWLSREKHGCKVRYIKSKEGVVTSQEIIDAIDENTFAVSLCSVEASSGYFYDLQRIGEYCRSKGIYFVVDSTQGLGAMVHDVEKMKIDVLVDSTYKWLSNIFGFGIGYIRKDLLPLLEPSHVGWTGTKSRTGDFANLELNLSNTAKKFETGGLNWTGLVGLEESLKIINSLGKEDIEKHIKELMNYLYSKIQNIKGVRLSPALDEKSRSSIAYLEMENPISKEEFLDRGVIVNVSGNKIRVGIHFYNNTDDIDALISVLGMV